MAIRVLHLTFHLGCARDLAYIGERSNMKVDFVPKLGSLDLTAGARAISRSEALEIWNQCKDLFNSYDVIVTSDIVALSRIFLENIQEVKPHIIVWICNRFSICMDQDQPYFELLRQAPKDKVTLVPYTEFERIWCGKFGIFVTEQTIQPLGCAPSNEQELARQFNSMIDTLNLTPTKDLTLEDISADEAAQTYVILNYGNNTKFVDLIALLKSAGLKAVCRKHKYVSTLAHFKGIIHLPDAFSKFTAAEALQQNIITFIPSPAFLYKLTQLTNNQTMTPYFFNIYGYGGQLQPEHVTLCDWYNYEGGRIYFNSFEDLVKKTKQLDSKETIDALKVDAQRDASRHKYLTITAWTKLIRRCAIKAGWKPETVPRWHQEPTPEVISTVKYLKCISASEN
jgi:hypothetical protein